MDILFWSGGKDAFLAYTFYRKENPDRPLKLLTTYNKKTGYVPHQHISIKHIKQQATSLNLEYLLIPLPDECPNDHYIATVTQAIGEEPKPVENLIFGDWYLQDIRSWRELQFQSFDYHCRFPIWKKSLHELLPALLLQPVEIHISAVLEEFEKYIQVGEQFNQHFIRQLPREIDPMGEKGEFHTKVIFKKWDNQQNAQPIY